MQKCLVPDCIRKIHAKSYCKLHYDRARKGDDLSMPIVKQRPSGATKLRDEQGNKQCSYCENWFDESYFKSHHSTSDKLDVRCKECETFARIERSYKVNKLYVQQTIKDQNGCAICNYNAPMFPVWWTIDHDHKCCEGNKSCGECVRGVLCSFCNRGLGQFNDSVVRLMNAANYIEGWDKIQK